MFENGRKVWWPIEYRAHDEDGNEVTQRMSVCYRLETDAERRARAKGKRTQLLHEAKQRMAQLLRGEVPKDDKASKDEKAPAPTPDPAQITDLLNKQMEQIDELEQQELAHNTSRIERWNKLVVDGEAVTYSAENLAALMAYTDWRQLFAQGYVDCCKGAVAKN